MTSQVTRLSDIIPIQQFTAVVEGKLTENSKFRQSGVVGSDARVTAKAQTAGLETSLREWARPHGVEAQAASDDPADKLATQKVQQRAAIARVIQRALAFSNMDVSDFVSDANAIDFAVSELVRLRLMDEESTLLATINGVLAEDAADYKVDAHVTSGSIAAANKLGFELFLAGRKKLGDMGGQLTNVILHSDVANALRALQPNAFIAYDQTNLNISNYMGYRLIETDQIGVDVTDPAYPVYTSYMAGDGLFAYAACPIANAIEPWRDPFAGGGSGQSHIINRFRYLLPMLGVSNVAAPANGISQTNAELATGATWSQVASRKAIPLVAIKTNG